MAVRMRTLGTDGSGTQSEDDHARMCAFSLDTSGAACRTTNHSIRFCAYCLEM